MPHSKKFRRDKEYKRKLILETTKALILEEGYEKLSTNHIAERANIGIGTIYRNFPRGKDDIIKEITFNSLEDFVKFDALQKITEKNFPEFLTQYLIKYINDHRKNYQENLAFQLSFLSNKRLYEDFEQQIKEVLSEYAENLKENTIFEDFSRVHITEKLYTIFNLIEALVHRHIFEVKVFDLDESLAKYLTKLILFSLKP